MVKSFCFFSGYHVTELSWHYKYQRVQLCENSSNIDDLLVVTNSESVIFNVMEEAQSSFVPVLLIQNENC